MLAVLRVFMDGIWTITMAFSLPLAKAAKKLSAKRPTASLLGPHTLFSACGVLAINFLFLVIALLALNAQDWYKCRKWGSNDVSDVTTIGDNYETSVIFIGECHDIFMMWSVFLNAFCCDDACNDPQLHLH